MPIFLNFDFILSEIVSNLIHSHFNLNHITIILKACSKFVTGQVRLVHL